MAQYELVTPIALVGPMGAGKSTLLRSLAQTLQQEALDVDLEIAKFAQQSITEIFKEHGEGYFRDLETRVLKYCVNCGKIIATGGGIISRKANFEILAKCYVIYLYTPVEVQYQRTLVDNDRPMIDVDDRYQRLLDLFKIRDPLYQKVSNFTVDTSKNSIKECTGLIIEKLLAQGILNKG